MFGIFKKKPSQQQIKLSHDLDRIIPVLVGHSIQCSLDILDVLKQKDNQFHISLLIEIIVLNIHLSDRVSFRYLDDKERLLLFGDVLLEKTFRYLNDNVIEYQDYDKYFKLFLKIYNIKDRIYGDCKDITATENQFVGDNVLSRFCSILPETLQIEQSDKFLYSFEVIQIQHIIVGHWAEIKMNDFLNNCLKI